jgi:SOS-response transcriptional repressor LexA
MDGQGERVRDSSGIAPSLALLGCPPHDRETFIGPLGFGVQIKGESMAGRGIHDGDMVWVNPELRCVHGDVVLAIATDDRGERGMVVKSYARTASGERLLSETPHGYRELPYREFKIVAPAVGLSHWLPLNCRR